MQVDPNQSVELRQEAVLCDGRGVVLWDGKAVAIAELDGEDNAFSTFCRSLDPNRCFIVGYITHDAHRPVFFKARDTARSLGIHMQSTVDTPERHLALWESYCTSKQLAKSEPESDPKGGA